MGSDEDPTVAKECNKATAIDTQHHCIHIGLLGGGCLSRSPGGTKDPLQWSHILKCMGLRRRAVGVSETWIGVGPC